MTALPLVITAAGLERFTQAQLGGDIDLSISEVGVTDAIFVVAPTLTALPGETRRLDTISGEAVGDNIVHIIVRDDAELAYGVRGFGLFLADGTLFAVYGQPTRIVEKAQFTSLLLAIDIAFPAGTVETISFGDTNFLNPPATTDTLGVVRLATVAEGIAGLNTRKAITAAVLKAVLDAFAVGIAATLAAIDALLGTLVPKTRLLAGSGLVTIDGDRSLAADRTIGVPKASAAMIVAGDDDASAITSLALASLPKLLEETGYETHPDGTIRQWGKVRISTSSETTASVTFPIAFPTAVFPPMLTGFIAAPSPLKDLWPQQAGEASLTGFTVQFQRGPAGDPAIDGFNWECWGR
ncbi:MAG: phage tail protein [Sphingomonas sp.]|nr:phage tail protein [Sphingomonas sp.]